jgi:hypothetical protein
MRLMQQSASEIPKLIEDLGGASSLAGELKLPATTVASWKHRGSIPVEHWPGIVRVAAERGKPEVSSDALMVMHASKTREAVRC